MPGHAAVRGGPTRLSARSGPRRATGAWAVVRRGRCPVRQGRRHVTFPQPDCGEPKGAGSARRGVRPGRRRVTLPRPDCGEPSARARARRGAVEAAPAPPVDGRARPTGGTVAGTARSGRGPGARTATRARRGDKARSSDPSAPAPQAPRPGREPLHRGRRPPGGPRPQSGQDGNPADPRVLLVTSRHG